MTDRPDEDSELDLNGLILPEDGIVDLTDKLTAYMTEIELGGLPDIIGQVLDDFLDQCGGMPEDLKDPSAFDQITRNQLAVTLAYQLGRLEGRSPQIVRLMIQQAIDSFGSSMVTGVAGNSGPGLRQPKGTGLSQASPAGVPRISG